MTAFWFFKMATTTPQVYFRFLMSSRHSIMSKFIDRSNSTCGFIFGDVHNLEWSKSICRPNFSEISQCTAEIFLKTNGRHRLLFYFRFRFSPLYHHWHHSNWPSASKSWRHIDFWRPRPSAMLDLLQVMVNNHKVQVRVPAWQLGPQISTWSDLYFPRYRYFTFRLGYFGRAPAEARVNLIPGRN